VPLDCGVLLVGALALDQQLLLEAADAVEIFVGLGLLRAEALLARQQFAEVDGMGVEIGAVDAGEAHFAVDGDAARAAHAGAVDHDGVQRHQRAHARRARDLGAGAHHGHRPDGHHQVGLLALEHLAQRLGDEAWAPGAAVVGAHDHLVAEGAQLVGPEGAAGVAKTHDTGGAVAGLLEGPQLGKHRRHAQAATHQHHMAHPLDVLRQAQRADEVFEAVALAVVVAHLARGLAQRLHDDGDGAALAVEVGHRERYALARFVQTQHHEVPRLRRRRHIRRQHFPQECAV
jgi:hypothetical protein